MKRNVWRRGAVIVAGCLVGILVVGVGLASAGKPPGTPGGNGKKTGKNSAGTNVTHTSNGVHGSAVLWASPSGSGSACTAHAPCSLTTAVTSASPGATVRAKSGTYFGSIAINTRLRLVGQGHAVLDASKDSSRNSIQNAGITVTASGASVSHFTVENAYYEGILVGDSSTATSGSAVDGVVIDHVIVRNNDTGFVGIESQGQAECYTAPNSPPGDCGEGIHLNSVTGSVVEHSRVEGNAGGILLTDEWGPTSGNVIQHNTVVNNTHDCGITLASHNTPGVTPPSSLGISHNVIRFNTVDGNGVDGEGGGILMAGGGPNTQVFDNTITHNEASGNGLAGVVIHQHFLSDLSGNLIVGNHLSNDNLDGDTDFQIADPQTTGILVASGLPPGFPDTSLAPAGPLSGTVIRNNQISNVEVGIWTLNVDPTTTTIAQQNHFGPNVGTPISTN